MLMCSILISLLEVVCLEGDCCKGSKQFIAYVLWNYFLKIVWYA